MPFREPVPDLVGGVVAVVAVSLTPRVREVTAGSVELAYVDQGYIREKAATAAAKKDGMKLGVVRLPGATQGFVLSPRRWVSEAELRVDGAGPAVAPLLRAVG